MLGSLKSQLTLLSVGPVSVWEVPRLSFTGLKPHQNRGALGSMEPQCKLTFSHATCLLNEQHAALVLHWWRGNQWSEGIPEHAKPYFLRLGLHVWQACWSGSQMNFSFKNRLPVAKRNKFALSPFRVRECFVVVLCGSELWLLPSWVSSFSVFQHGCNAWKHAVWERRKGRRGFCSKDNSVNNQIDLMLLYLSPS